jgi:hypothetical protein
VRGTNHEHENFYGKDLGSIATEGTQTNRKTERGASWEKKKESSSVCFHLTPHYLQTFQILPFTLWNCNTGCLLTVFSSGGCFISHFSFLLGFQLPSLSHIFLISPFSLSFIGAILGWRQDIDSPNKKIATGAQRIQLSKLRECLLPSHLWCYQSKESRRVLEIWKALSGHLLLVGEFGGCPVQVSGIWKFGENRLPEVKERDLSRVCW